MDAERRVKLAAGGCRIDTLTLFQSKKCKLKLDPYAIFKQQQEKVKEARNDDTFQCIRCILNRLEIGEMNHWTTKQDNVDVINSGGGESFNNRGTLYRRRKIKLHVPAESEKYAKQYFQRFGT